VESVLEQNDLDSLINKDLPHSEVGHPKFIEHMEKGVGINHSTIKDTKVI
jgi:hypothetical protein